MKRDGKGKFVKTPKETMEPYSDRPTMSADQVEEALQRMAPKVRPLPAREHGPKAEEPKAKEAGKFVPYPQRTFWQARLPYIMTIVMLLGIAIFEGFEMKQFQMISGEAIETAIQYKNDFDSLYKSFTDLSETTQSLIDNGNAAAHGLIDSANVNNITAQSLWMERMINKHLDARHAADQVEIKRLHKAIDKLQCAYQKATDGQEHLCDKEQK